MPTIKLYANLRKLAGTKELSVPGKRLGDALAELVRRCPALRDVIVEDAHLCPHVLVTLNGHNVTDVEVAVTEKDNIAVFPPLAGG